MNTLEQVLLSPQGIILGCIALLALMIYWFLFDLMQTLFLQGTLTEQERKQCQQQSHQLQGWVSTLPLLGLLGTVGGLLDSFNGLASGNQQMLTGGIAEALLTTQLGLTTALPALLLLQLCQRRCRYHPQQNPVQSDTAAITPLPSTSNQEAKCGVHP